MNLLSIYIMQSCNLDCYYCPMKPWIKPLDFKFPFEGNEGTKDWTEEQKEASRWSINTITNKFLFKWLDAYIKPDEWVVEITGGEPGLYPEISFLVQGLNERGYLGVIKTNGLLPIPKSNNFKLVTAWHEGLESIPPYYDYILLIKNPYSDWRRKAAFCKAHGIFYRALAFNKMYKGVSSFNLVTQPNNFLLYTAIMSMGQVVSCPIAFPVEGSSIQNMSSPLTLDLTRCCPFCGSAAGVRIFLPEDLLRRVDEEAEVFYARM